MAARRQAAVAVRQVDSTKCCVGSCGEPLSVTCVWKEHETNAETGQRIYNGRTCGLRLCGAHVQRGKDGPLCLWHFTVEQRGA